MRVAVQKLPGVESVNVSLERASTDIRLRAGNTITLDQLRSIIKNNGFTTKDALVTVTGKLIERGGQPALEVTGTNAVMLIVADPKQPAIFEQLQQRLATKQSAPIQLVGLTESRPDAPDRISVTSMSEQ